MTMLMGLPLWQLLALVVLGGVAGASSGLLGIGGGVIMVPALVLLFAFGQRIAQGTALAVMIPTALIGAYTYASGHKVSWPAVAVMVVGSIAGARYGATLALVLPQEVLRTLFALLMVIAAVRMMPSGSARDMGMLAGVLVIAVALRLFVLK
jgi:uncharacterized membrane protein YfcA